MPQRVSVDFTGVQDSPVTHVPPGPYKMKLASAKPGKSKQGLSKITVKWQILLPAAYRGTVITRDFSLQPQALFALRNMLIAHGYDIPKAKATLDLDGWKGRECGALMVDKSFTNQETGKKTISSEVSEFITVAQYETMKSPATSVKPKAVAAAQELIEDEEAEETELEDVEEDEEETDDDDLELDDL